MKTWILALVILLGAGGYYGYQYWQDWKERLKAEEEAKRKAEEEEEAKRRAEEEEEAKRKAEEGEADKRKAEKGEADKRKAEEEARRKAEKEAKRKVEEGEADKRKAEKDQDRPNEGEERSEAEKLEARQEAWKLSEKLTVEERLQVVRETVEKRVNDFTLRLLFASESVYPPRIRVILGKDPDDRTENEWKELDKFQDTFLAKVIREGEKFSKNLEKRPEERSPEEKEHIETVQKKFEDFLAILQKSPEETTETEKGLVADFETFYDLFFFQIRAVFGKRAKNRSPGERETIAAFEPIYGKWLSAVLDDVYEIMPLDIDKTNNKKLSPEFLRQSEERARVAYPVSDEALKERLSAEAEEKFPVYHVGEVVTVYHAIYGGTFDKLTGKFRREDPKFVWIGDKKIDKAKLREDIAPRFDRNRIEKIKKEYVEQGILNYSRQRSLYESKLNEAELRNIRGFIQYEGKFLSPKKATAQILHDTVYGKPAAPRPPNPLRRKRKARRTIDTSSPFRDGGVLGRTQGKKSMLH